MANIVDRRLNGRNKSLPNRKKFIDRYKGQLKKKVEEIATNRDMKGLMESDHEIDIGISEPHLETDPYTGHDQWVVAGNEEYEEGDKFQKSKQKSSGNTGEGEEGEDNFTFTLSPEEFLDIYFSDLELPDFLKTSNKRDIEFKYKRAGYSKYGIPARLNLKKSMEQAIARRISTQAQITHEIEELEAVSERTAEQEQQLALLKKKKPLYLDPEDIRYNLYVKNPKPIKHAVMICIMDVSASMEELEKTTAKRFFSLLYMFLHKEYKSVELVFIRHTHEAEEVNEFEFFYGRKTGGTLVCSAYELAADIIDTRYDLSTTNIYVTHASDGDVWIEEDGAKTVEILQERILPKVQYAAYLEIDPGYRNGSNSLWSVLHPISEHNPHFGCGIIGEDLDVYQAFRKLFEKS